MSEPKMVPAAPPKSRAELKADTRWGVFWIVFGSALVGLSIAYELRDLVLVAGVAFVAFGAFNVNRKLVEDFALLARSVLRNGRAGDSSYPGSRLSEGGKRTEVLSGAELEPGGRATWGEP